MFVCVCQTQYFINIVTTWMMKILLIMIINDNNYSILLPGFWWLDNRGALHRDIIIIKYDNGGTNNDENST